jgi:hypothetical protein
LREQQWGLGWQQRGGNRGGRATRELDQIGPCARRDAAGVGVIDHALLHLASGHLALQLGEEQRVERAWDQPEPRRERQLGV